MKKPDGGQLNTKPMNLVPEGMVLGLKDHPCNNIIRLHYFSAICSIPQSGFC